MIKQRNSPLAKAQVTECTSIPVGDSQQDERDLKKKHHHGTGVSVAAFRRTFLAGLVGLSLVACIALVAYDVGYKSGEKQDKSMLIRSLKKNHDGEVENDLNPETELLRKFVPPKSRVVDVDSALPPELIGTRYRDLWDMFECRDYFETAERPTNYRSVWEDMRKIYIQVMKPDPFTSRRLLQEDTAMQVPYSVHQSEDKGLGLFARRKIKKGQLVDTTKSGGRVTFNNGDDFRRYLYSVRAPDQACVAMQCSAVESHYEKNPQENAFIAIDLDDSCFMNQDTDNPNIISGGEECPECDYANRDIKIGEEFLCDYGSYAYGHGWKWFGL